MMKSYQVGQHPGAVWRRVDLQVHTPRDHNWVGGSPLPGGHQEQEEARLKWARALVISCLEKDLEAIAITDHHDVGMIPYVREALEELDSTDDIWLYPGMEVTCNDACQALILLDTQATQEQQRRLFGLLPEISPAEDDAPRLPQAQQCGKTIEELIEAVMADAVVEPVSIVLPHAGDEGAHKSVLRAGFNSRFKNLACDGVYTEKPFAKLKERTKNIVFGEDHAWGERRRGLIPTGDNRQADFADLGKSPCWIRLGEPTVEALRQALLVDEARISYERPTLPAQRILGCRISSALTGQISFLINDGLTAVIGGRGSGKSAMLEYLRFGLGRSSLDMEAGSPEHNRLRTLLMDTLKDGRVEVVLERDGVKETWQRTLGAKDTIIVRLENGEEEELTIAVAQERFRARAYEQKELSSILPDTDSAMEQITSIAAAELWEQRHAAEAAVKRAKRDVRQAFLNVVEFWHADAEMTRVSSHVEDISRRLTALAKQLEEEGLNEDERATLEAAPSYTRGKAFLEEAEAQVQEAELQAAEIRDELYTAPVLPEIPDEPDFKPVRDFQVTATKVEGTIRARINDALSELRTLNDSLQKNKKGFLGTLKRFNERHRKALKHRSAFKQLIEEQERLQQDLASAEANQRQVAKRISGLKAAPQDLLDARAKLAETVQERRVVLEEACSETEGMSGGLLRAKVLRRSTPTDYVEALEELASGANIHNLRSRLEEFVEQLVKDTEEPDEERMREDTIGWDEVADRVMRLFRRRVRAGDQVEQVHAEEVRSDLGDEILPDLTERSLQQLISRMSEDRVVRILTAVNEDYIAFHYKDRDRFIRFESASPGQQASALLQLLLNQEAGTLIIDQPEEDLDSEIVMKIVSLIRRTKQKRQIIFATHNPNFVVNGDADKVLALRPTASRGAESGGGKSTARIRLWVDGALESSEVRDAVIKTIDGGKEAFELRRRKYKLPELRS